jgi:hypothetical protein
MLLAEKWANTRFVQDRDNPQTGVNLPDDGQEVPVLDLRNRYILPVLYTKYYIRVHEIILL